MGSNIDPLIKSKWSSPTASLTMLPIFCLPVFLPKDPHLNILDYGGFSLKWILKFFREGGAKPVRRMRALHSPSLTRAKAARRFGMRAVQALWRVYWPT
jgi:hypothetical protein